MFFEKKDRLLVVYRRNWGGDAIEPIRKIEVALDAITPSIDDCSMRIIYREAGRYAVSITFYPDIYFAPPILAIRNVTLSQEVVDELLAKKYVIPFSLFAAPTERSTMLTVSDLGEMAWARMIGN